MASQDGLFCMTLIVIHCNDFDSYIGGNIQSSCIVTVLVKVFTIPCHDRGHINVVLVLQSCSDSLYIPPGSSSDTYATTSDCAYHIGNMKVEEDLEWQREEEEVNVKAEKDIGSEEEECIVIKDEEGVYSEEEEEENVGIKEEVS